MTDSVLHVNEAEVTTLTINRPAALNALNPAVLEALAVAIEALPTKKHIRSIILTGSGDKAFVAGADIREMAGFSKSEMQEYITLGQRVMEQIQHCSLPVIAMVNGFALGGGLELALACDFIIASETARVGLPEVSLGIIPGYGGTQRLIERAGLGVAKRVILTGDMLDARTALTLGIVDQLAPAAELEKTTAAVAGLIAQRGPLAIQKAKVVLNAYAEKLRTPGLAAEVQAFMDLFETDDRKEGMAAFLEKRAVNFSGS